MLRGMPGETRAERATSIPVKTVPIQGFRSLEKALAALGAVKVVDRAVELRGNSEGSGSGSDHRSLQLRASRASLVRDG